MNLNKEDLVRLRTWFHALQDLSHPDYLQKEDYQLALRIAETIPLHEDTDVSGDTGAEDLRYIAPIVNNLGEGRTMIPPATPVDDQAWSYLNPEEVDERLAEVDARPRSRELGLEANLDYHVDLFLDTLAELAYRIQSKAAKKWAAGCLTSGSFPFKLHKVTPLWSPDGAGIQRKNTHPLPTVVILTPYRGTAK